MWKHENLWFWPLSLRAGSSRREGPWGEGRLFCGQQTTLFLSFVGGYKWDCTWGLAQALSLRFCGHTVAGHHPALALLPAFPQEACSGDTNGPFKNLQGHYYPDVVGSTHPMFLKKQKIFFSKNTSHVAQRRLSLNFKDPFLTPCPWVSGFIHLSESQLPNLQSDDRTIQEARLLWGFSGILHGEGL